MKYAMIFPGQATEIVDPRENLKDFPGARSVFNFSENFFKGLYEKTEEKLMLTLNQQPAVAFHSLAVANALNTEGFDLPAAVAGHSLGAIVSLIYAQVLPDDIGPNVLSTRARITQRWADQKPGKMVAILGVGYDEVNFICQKLSKQGKIVVLANYNEPKQSVISGLAVDVDEACAEITRLFRPKKIIPLPTKVAFHSPLLKGASEEFDRFLSWQIFSDPANRIKVVIDDQVFHAGKEIKKYMQGHMFRPVMWVSSLRLLMEICEINNFLVVGPGQKMVKMIKRTADFFNHKVKVICLSKAEDIKIFLENPFA